MPKFIQGKEGAWIKPAVTPMHGFETLRYRLMSASIKNHVSSRHEDTPSSLSKIDVDVDQYHILSSTSPAAILETRGLGTCVGLLLFCPQTNKVLLAHCLCSNPTLEENFRRILSEFETDGTQLVGSQAILFGGRCNFPASIKTADILIDLLKEKSVALDSMHLFPFITPEKPQLTSIVRFNPQTETLSIQIHQGETVIKELRGDSKELDNDGSLPSP